MLRILLIGNPGLLTIASILALVLALVFIAMAGNARFEREFKKDVAVSLTQDRSGSHILTEADLTHLPEPVQKYLRYVGVINKPIVKNYRVIFKGEMRDKGKDWFSFRSEQYNFTEVPTRLFFMKAKMFGITVPGYHAYKNGSASMRIKIFGLYPVIDEHGGILDQAETVTIFNDMCLMAPATLIDTSIQWEQINDTTVRARFTVGKTSIHALLYFNHLGQLLNFESDDRYAIADKRKYKFSTPVAEYRSFHGYNLPGYGEAVWHFPDGAFIYGRFHTQDIVYNTH